MVPEQRLPSERPLAAAPLGLPSAALWADGSSGEDRSRDNTKYSRLSVATVLTEANTDVFKLPPSSGVLKTFGYSDKGNFAKQSVDRQPNPLIYFTKTLC